MTKRALGVLAIKTGTPSIFPLLSIFSEATSYYKHCFHSESVILPYVCFLPITLKWNSEGNCIKDSERFLKGVWCCSKYDFGKRFLWLGWFAICLYKLGIALHFVSIITKSKQSFRSPSELFIVIRRTSLLIYFCII